MADEIRTVAIFHIICSLPFGTPCEHYNCCHFILTPYYDVKYECPKSKPTISFCEYAKPVSSHIDCKEIE